MTRLTVYARAKINLTLDVFNRRSDGYHSIASVFQAISLQDTLTLTGAAESGIRLTCDGPHAAGVPVDDTNLVVRAARALLDVAHCESGLDIHLRKEIPSQAGLGGGSSDAAAALIGAATLFGIDAGPRLLRELAIRLGSDVPFFLSGGTAVVRGRGENISPIADAPALWLVLVKPDESVSTAWAYGALDAIEERASNRATSLLEGALKSGDAARTIACQSNDFEAPVFARYPGVAWLRDQLQMAGAVAAHLCGSGSAVYGVARDRLAAERIAASLRPSYANTAVARTLSRIESNPLRELAL
ncbi:MAG TPA: 4-(cytidine 5'-diphospho)-2-C-methyl-D-erythritol kinase [Chthonomonadaceae bacterium]|nr:4-(cytidine 5'-diphospho)-2-C-methyl-D-erythritol kinase [Chthonomonadaceae bacterium]